MLDVFQLPIVQAYEDRGSQAGDVGKQALGFACTSAQRFLHENGRGDSRYRGQQGDSGVDAMSA